MHWAVRSKLAKLWEEAIEETFRGQGVYFERCSIVFRLYSTAVKDWENCAASFKLIGDALKKCVIPDDDPSHILSFFMEQKRVPKREQCRVEVLIRRED